MLLQVKLLLNVLLRLANVNDWRMLIQVCEGAAAGDEPTAGQGLHSLATGRLLWSAADKKGGRAIGCRLHPQVVWFSRIKIPVSQY